MDWPKALKKALDDRAKSLPDGWTMHINPVDHLPQEFSSANFQADAVATGPEGGIAFELLFRGLPASQQKISQLADMRRRLESVPGWSLEVIYYSAPEEDLAPYDEVEEKLRSAERIINEFSPEDAPLLQAAFILAFSALEWKIAYWSKRQDLQYTPNARRMAEVLVSEGLIPEEVYSEIRNFQGIRNAIAHSLAHRTPVTSEIVRELLTLVNGLDDEIAHSLEDY